MIIGELPDLEDTQAGKELIAVGEKRGEQRGEERGEERGKKLGEQRGELNGLRNAILFLLQANAVSISEEMRQQIVSLDYNRAVQLLPLVAKWNSVEPLQKWLAENRLS